MDWVSHELLTKQYATESKGPGRYTRESAHHPELLVGLLQRGRVLVGWVMVCWKVPWKRYQIIINAGWGEITDNTEMKYCIIPWVFCLTTEHSHCSRWQSFWAQHLDEREAAALPGDLTFGGRWHHWWHLDEIFEWLELGSFCSQKFNNHINHASLKSAKIHDFKVRSDLERNVADTEARLKNDIRQKQQEAGSSEWSKLQSPQKMNSGLWEDWGCRTASRVEEWLGEPEIFPVSFSSLLEDSCWKFGSCCFWCTKSKICVPSQISVFLKVRARKSFPPLLIPAGDESIVFMCKLRPQFGDTSKITLEYGRHCPCPPGVYKNYKTWWWIIFRFIFLVGGSVDFHPLDEVRKPLAAWGPWTCAWVACREDRSKNWWICRRRKAAQS